MTSSPMELYELALSTDSMSRDPAQAAALIPLQRLFEDLCAQPQKQAQEKKGLLGFLGFGQRAEPVRGIYIHGPVGRGKTALMDLFYAAVPKNIKKKRVHFHDFMIGVHNHLHKARQQTRPGTGPDTALIDYADRIASDVRVLCFDEFHVTDVADAMILGRLFTALFDRGLALVATSNWEPERLYDGGLQRDRFLPFIALVRAQMDVVQLAGPEDYRLRALRDAGVYFCPLGPAAREKAETLIDRLTDGTAFHEETITVKGRQVTIRCACNVARATFGQLCERPLGAEDYIAIAANYPTLFLEGVPKLTYDRRNEAKRLMTLIDVLYDHNTRLIVTADAPPEELYRGHDHAFEFQRTVSRLIEMQGRDYLARTGADKNKA